MARECFPNASQFPMRETLFPVSVFVFKMQNMLTLHGREFKRKSEHASTSKNFASTLLIFASNSSKGQILRALSKWMGPFDTPMMVLSIMMKNYLLLRKHTQFKKSREKTIPIWDHNDQNRYPVYDQNSWNTIPFGAAHTYIAHIREYSLGGLWPQCGFSADHYILTVT